MTMTNHHASYKRYRDQGVSILIIAVSMIFVLGMAGMAIDLASLYVGRSEAQRAADAAALAAAQYLAGNGCTSNPGGTISQACEDIAKQQAVAVGNQNLIAGASPKMTLGDITFLSTSTNDPQVQTIAARDTARGNPMPTFFVKIFGIDTANVSARAIAEAYNPAGEPNPVGAKCLKPWLLPNCDPDHTQATVGGPISQYCDGQAQFVEGTDPEHATIVDDLGNVSQGGVQGELITIKSSKPSDASGPSKFYPVYLPADANDPSLCPSCATGGAGSGPASGSLYRQNIACCNQTQIVCGTNTIQPITGDMVGPTGLGVDCLIHQKGNSGQDILDPNTLLMTAGSRNPYGNALGAPIQNSDSLVTVPLYEGFTLCPGNSCPSQITVNVVGFLRMFIKDEVNGNVEAYVIDVAPCPAGGGPGPGPGGGGGVIAGGGSPIVVRLIHQ